MFLSRNFLFFRGFPTHACRIRTVLAFGRAGGIFDGHGSATIIMCCDARHICLLRAFKLECGGRESVFLHDQPWFREHIYFPGRLGVGCREIRVNRWRCGRRDAKEGAFIRAPLLAFRYGSTFFISSVFFEQTSQKTRTHFHRYIQRCRHSNINHRPPTTDQHFRLVTVRTLFLATLAQDRILPHKSRQFFILCHPIKQLSDILTTTPKRLVKFIQYLSAEGPESLRNPSTKSTHSILALPRPRLSFSFKSFCGSGSTSSSLLLL